MYQLSTGLQLDQVEVARIDPCYFLYSTWDTVAAQKLFVIY